MDLAYLEVSLLKDFIRHQRHLHHLVLTYPAVSPQKDFVQHQQRLLAILKTKKQMGSRVFELKHLDLGLGMDWSVVILGVSF